MNRRLTTLTIFKSSNASSVCANLPNRRVDWLLVPRLFQICPRSNPVQNSGRRHTGFDYKATGESVDEVACSVPSSLSLPPSLPSLPQGPVLLFFLSFFSTGGILQFFFLFFFFFLLPLLCVFMCHRQSAADSHRTGRLLQLVGRVLLYVHRNRRLFRDGSPGRPPRLSHSS